MNNKKNDITELVFILDKSGSMSGLEQDTIGGFNSMIEKQRALDGKVYVSTVLFDTKAQVLHDRVPLDKVQKMTAADYNPSGCTALLDALGGAIHHIVNIHRYARSEDVPANTVFVITTDGMENSSTCYSADDVRAMIRKEEEKYGWKFLFLAANIDAVRTARGYGIRPDMAANYRADADGTEALYDTVSEAVECIRAQRPMAANWKSRLKANN